MHQFGILSVRRDFQGQVYTIGTWIPFSGDALSTWPSGTTSHLGTHQAAPASCACKLCCVQQEVLSDHQGVTVSLRDAAKDSIGIRVEWRSF